jgi:hypothetical protein
MMDVIFWNEKVDQQQCSGLSVDAWCKQQGIAVSSFYKWKRVCRSSLFEQVKLQEDAIPTIQESVPAIVLIAGNVRILLEDGFSPSLLHQVLEVLNS